MKKRAYIPPAALNEDDELATLELRAIGRRIRDMRTDRGWTQDDLGDACEVNRSGVSLWEHGKRPPSTTMLLRLADAFGCTVEYLIRGTKHDT